jgi:hypothetical protein
MPCSTCSSSSEKDENSNIVAKSLTVFYLKNGMFRTVTYCLTVKGIGALLVLVVFMGDEYPDFDKLQVKNCNCLIQIM